MKVLRTILTFFKKIFLSLGLHLHVELEVSRDKVDGRNDPDASDDPELKE